MYRLFFFLSENNVLLKDFCKVGVDSSFGTWSSSVSTARAASAEPTCPQTATFSMYLQRDDSDMPPLYGGRRKKQNTSTVQEIWESKAGVWEGQDGPQFNNSTTRGPERRYIGHTNHTVFYNLETKKPRGGCYTTSPGNIIHRGGEKWRWTSCKFIQSLTITGQSGTSGRVGVQSAWRKHKSTGGFYLKIEQLLKTQQKNN